LTAISYSRLYPSSSLSRAAILLGFDKSVMITWFLSPAESKICVDAFYGLTHERARLRSMQRLSLQCRSTNQSDQFGGPVRPVSPGQPDKNPTNAYPGGTPSG
jgi:hypothetical protein